MTALHPEHLCRVAGETVRHRTPIDFTPVKLNGGGIRLEGARCDGTGIALIASVLPSGTIVTEAGEGYPERIMYEPSTGREWVSWDFGPWEILIDLPAQDSEEPYQPSLPEAL